MPIYSTNSYQKPFWAENSGFMTGRDPLGVQNSSITVYGKLLPGLTNLTLRLRYYGFYMWVLKTYHEKNREQNESNLLYHYNYIRRAELILAFIMRKLDPDEQSVIGSDYTTRHENIFDEQGYYDIHLGADKEQKNDHKVYWDFPSGALGQYYAGALTALGLIKTFSKYFILEDKGKQLASAFEQSVDAPLRKKFLDIIEDGELQMSDIEFLKPFKVNKIKVESEEWKFYCDLLKDRDGDDIKDQQGDLTSIRKRTIGLLLGHYSKENKSDSAWAFIEAKYLQNLETDDTNDASFGWFYYYINEAFHYALETFFWAILDYVDGKNIPIEVFLEEVTELIVSGSESAFINDRNSQVIDNLIELEQSELITQINELDKLKKVSINLEEAVGRAMKVLMTLSEIVSHRIKRIEEFELKYRINEQKGRVSENNKIYIDNCLGMSISEYGQHIIKMIMTDHVNTAYRKMGNGESNLLKFIIEDNQIGHVQTMTPRNTSPRLRTITNFMHDLKFVEHNQLTEVGKAYLESISA